MALRLGGAPGSRCIHKLDFRSAEICLGHGVHVCGGFSLGVRLGPLRAGHGTEFSLYIGAGTRFRGVCGTSCDYAGIQEVPWFAAQVISPNAAPTSTDPAIQVITIIPVTRCMFGDDVTLPTSQEITPTTRQIPRITNAVT